MGTFYILLGIFRFHIDEDLLYKSQNGNKKRWSKGFKQLIDTAIDLDIINDQQKSLIDNIRNQRNDIVHGLGSIDGDAPYQFIMDTKEIIESLCSN